MRGDKIASRLTVAAVLLLALSASYWWLSKHPGSKPLPDVKMAPAAANAGNGVQGSAERPSAGKNQPRGFQSADLPSGDGADDGDEQQLSEEDKADAEAQAAADSFDEAVDGWRDEVAEGTISLAKINEFSQMFKNLPEKHKEDCLRRALNLVPDSNFEILLGLLVDKTTGDDYIQLIFDDMMNRSEEVKHAILREIMKDRSHPCWAQAAWVLDATGQLEEGVQERP